MSVASVGSASTAPVMPAQVKVDRPNDGDADDVGGAKAPVQAAPAPGTGQVVDKRA
ncbi:MAG: hypothetical protein AB1490_16195 [Pseudomonadota bacterium]